MMSWDEIKQMVDPEGDRNYVGVGVVNLSVDDASVTVVRWFGNLDGEGKMYSFHRVFISLWSWGDSTHIVSSARN